MLGDPLRTSLHLMAIEPAGSIACKQVLDCGGFPGFFLGISPGRIGGTSSRNKIEELPL